ncbi:MAG: 5-formyltetrahydrofolate cyclo-ligase [Alphaproteobacteria bacterium]
MNQDLDLLKKIQRKEQSKKRLLIDTSIVSNNAFYNKLTKNYWFNSSKIVASFLSIKSEISTDALNQYLLSLGKILCLPIIENNKEILIFKRYCIGDELKKGKFGVSEPLNSQTYLPDIIFVPCLAFDENGFRLGYGGGYYDKSIANLYSIKHKFISIGVAYEEQKVKNVVHDSLDQKLNYILTEKQLYNIL